MKHTFRTLASIMLVFFISQTGWAQSSITLNFSAEHSSSAIIIPLDSVVIENRTVLGDTVIYGSTPSVVFTFLGVEEGLNVRENNKINLFAYPNPFASSSRIELYVPENGTYDVAIYNSLGQVESLNKKVLNKGTYSLQLSLNSKGTYHCSVSNEKYSKSIQLINLSSQKGNSVALEISNLDEKAKNPATSTTLKSLDAINFFEFLPGDELFITAYKFGYVNDTITVYPTQSNTIIFQMEPTAACPSKVFDADGNEYAVTEINGKCWMAENMKTTKFTDGTTIGEVTVPSTWSNLASTPGYCMYGNSAANGESYGYIYNWAAAMQGAASSALSPSGVQGICPVGWHLPSDLEFDEMGEYIADANGGSTSGYTNTDGNWVKVGKHLKSVPDWATAAGTDDYSFTGLPGGSRTYSGGFSNIGVNTYWWSATQLNNIISYGWGLEDSSHKFLRNNLANKASGFYVRCVRD